MKLDEIISNYETRLIDKNDNKWDVIETSDLAEICQEYHKQQLDLHSVGCSALEDVVNYIENKEYNYLNKGLLDFANDVQFFVKNKIHEANK